MIAISSCLVGINCTYKGSNHYIPKLKKLVDEGKAITICPEVLGGMSIPRDPCEINGDMVISINQEEKTKEYYDGAYKSLEIIKKHNIEIVLLKAKSPSCGKGYIYDGSFSHRLVNGNGITTKVLEQNGIIVYNEDTIEEFLKEIEKRNI